MKTTLRTGSLRLPSFEGRSVWLERVKWLLALAVVATAMLGASGSAFAQKGTGEPCTSGWPTNYQCEEFGWNSARSASLTLWSTSQGYCYLNAAALGVGANTGHVEVVASGGNWTLQGGPTDRTYNRWGSAICVAYPGYQSYIQGSYVAGSSTTNSTKLTNNKNFCSLAGLQYTLDASHPTSFATAAYAYPSTPTAVDMNASVQNGYATTDIAYGQCLVAPGSFWLYWGDGYWWGNQTYGNSHSNQDVFTYSTGTAYFVTDAPAYNTNCMITQIYPVKGKSFS
ncbi:MAG TPA: hypothetical protein VH560_12820, partial [Polyangia bacterium]|nr:hypothetical protein [Polyangia bacterium]